MRYLWDNWMRRPIWSSSSGYLPITLPGLATKAIIRVVTSNMTRKQRATGWSVRPATALRPIWVALLLILGHGDGARAQPGPPPAGPATAAAAQPGDEPPAISALPAASPLQGAAEVAQPAPLPAVRPR